MSDPEQFKYDVRVRERMLRKGLIQEPEVEKHLQALPDLEGRYVDLELKQPALRQDSEPASVRPPPPPSPAPAATVTSFEPARSNDFEAVTRSSTELEIGPDDDDDEEDEDEDEDEDTDTDEEENDSLDAKDESDEKSEEEKVVPGGDASSTGGSPEGNSDDGWGSGS